MASNLVQARLELIAAKAKIMAAQNMWTSDLVRGLQELASEIQQALQEARNESRDDW